MFMSSHIASQGMAGELTNEVCRGRDLSGLSEERRAICLAANGEGLRLSMAATTLFFIPAAALFLLASRTYQKDLVARPH
jgi:hypothetical protein